MTRLLPTSVIVGMLTLLSACVTTEPAREEFAPPVYPPPPDEARFRYERTILSSADVVP